MLFEGGFSYLHGIVSSVPSLTSRARFSAGSSACGFVYGANGSVDFQSFRLYAAYENGVGGVIPYEGTPLKANNKILRIGLIYLIK